MIFQTEKQLKDYGDKISANNKTALENALAELRQAHSAKDVAAIDKALETLNAAWQNASQEMYSAAQGGAQEPGNQGQPQSNGSTGDNVTDVDYEEVENKNK